MSQNYIGSLSSDWDMDNNYVVQQYKNLICQLLVLARVYVSIEQ